MEREGAREYRAGVIAIILFINVLIYMRENRDGDCRVGERGGEGVKARGERYMRERQEGERETRERERESIAQVCLGV